ncbi:MAG: DUF63 family protein [Salinigranum sp.]
MAVLPEGFALPPLPYLLVLLAGLVAVGAAFRRRRPRLTDRRILALVPWMAAGAALHVLFVLDELPDPLRPFAGTPAVYLTVAVLAGATWLAAERLDFPVAESVAVVGAVALLPPLVTALAVGFARGTLHLLWPGVGVVVALVLAGVEWALLRRFRPSVRVAGWVGALVVFGHALDAVSTAVGVDVFGFGERTPLSRAFIDAAARFPTANVLGTGWLFVLVKLAVAGLVVVLLADLVRDEPLEGYLLLGVVAAVGLGPGLHNLLLFSVAG